MTSVEPDAIEAAVKRMQQGHRVPGVSVAVAFGGELAHAAGYGLASVELNSPAHAATVYQTASVGKQFTAALVLLLAERGLWRLDDAVARYLDLPDFSRDVTLRRLLSHTSGVSDTGYDALHPRLDYDDAALLNAIARVPLEFAPGSQWAYSNAGYVLLGIAIGNLTSRFYGDLLRDWIFQPLGMSSTRVISEDAIVPNRAAGYRLDAGDLRNQEYVSPSLNRTADGALYTTVLDLAKWDRALSQPGAVLAAPSLELLWTAAPLTDGSRCAYGMGWFLSESPSGRIAEHDGEWQGFSSHIVRYLDRALTVIVLANLAEAPAAGLAREIAALYLK